MRLFRRKTRAESFSYPPCDYRGCTDTATSIYGGAYTRAWNGCDEHDGWARTCRDLENDRHFSASQAS